MDRIFSLDSKFFKVMNRVGNVIYLSILWMIGCIPIVTICASTIAFYYAMVKAVRRENGYVSTEFFRSYKDNLKKSIPVTLLFMVAGVLLYIDRVYMQGVEGEAAAAISLLYTLLSLVVIALFHYLIPVMSRFTMGRIECLKLAGIMVFRHLPYTVVMLVISIIGACIIFVMPIPMLFIMPGACCYVQSLLMEKLLLRYMAKPMTEADREKWYYGENYQ